MSSLDELYTGKTVQIRQKTSATDVLQRTARSSVIVGEETVNEKAYARKADADCSGVIESVENACGGNKYLEAMVLGEILNSPRFKKR